MFGEMNIMEIIKLLLPFIILELGLKIYCIIQLLRNGAKYFPDWVWSLIIIFISTFGPIAFLIFGRKKDY